MTERSREEAMEFLRTSGLPLYEREGWLPIDIAWEGWLPIDIACLLDRTREEARWAGIREGLADILSWLDAEIEAARQLNRQDPIATRSALERVKARLVG